MKDKESKSIVHIATDQKFIDSAYDIYERAFPGENKFIILLDEDVSDVKYLSSERNYTFIKAVDNFITEIKPLIKGSSLIVFHGLETPQGLIANNIDKNGAKFLWNVFGHEVYNNYEIVKNDYYGSKTYDKFIFSYFRILRIIARPFFYRLIKGTPQPNVIKRNSIKRMDYLGAPYEEELNKYKELKIVNDDIELVNFTYYPMNIVIEKKSGFVKSDNILLGNSASYTNNHLEAIEILKKLDYKNRDIITPLSYGNHEYGSQLVEIGKQNLGENFKPLIEFLPLSEYQKILQNCGIVIMNHYRQQAVGNVMNALYLGAKVYLSNRNTLYHYLKRIECHIYCIEEDLVPENQSVFDLLSKKQMIENRNILKRELSLERVINELKQKLTPVLN